MLGLISILLPAILAVSILEKLQSTKKSCRDFLVSYFVFLLFITLITQFIFVVCMHQTVDFPWNLLTSSSILQYLSISFATAIVLPVLYFWICKAISIELEIKKEDSVNYKEIRKKEKKEKKHGKKK